MRVYVAGASAEVERAEKQMELLRASGIEVTSTWPEVIRKVGEANPMSAPLEDRRKWAALDLNQVGQADVFWFLLPDGKPSAGAYTEFGFALMLGQIANQARLAGVEDAPNRWVLVSGKESSIFTALANHFATDDEARLVLEQRHALLKDAARRR